MRVVATTLGLRVRDASIGDDHGVVNVPVDDYDKLFEHLCLHPRRPDDRTVADRMAAAAEERRW